MKIIPILLALTASIALSACAPQTQSLCANQPAAATGLTDASVVDLKTEDLTVGAGREAKAGDTVEVHYIGRLVNGNKFDSSCDRNQPFAFQLGAGMVIPGWDQGVAGMKEGGKRRLIIPSRLGYGSQGVGPIPANAALVFDVELVKVK